MKNIIILAAVAIGLASCNVKDPIYETSHPTAGRITLTTDWTAVAADITIPASYAIKMGDYSATLSGKTNTLSNLFAPGAYHANIYNSADKITVSGTAATVAAINATTVDPMPGWLMTSTLDATIEKDKDYNLTAVVKQQVRQLTLIITPDGGTASRIESITATLSGVASKLNIDTDATSDPANVALAFAKQADGSYQATVRLLGTAGTEQHLTTTIAFTGGSPASVIQTSDLTTLLAGFNTDKKTPMTLGSQSVDTVTEAGFTATINDWTDISDAININ